MLPEQERYEGILQAIDALKEEEEQGGHGAEAEGSAKPQGPPQAARNEPGEGRDVLTEEALSTMQPGDVMPRPVGTFPDLLGAWCRACATHGLGKL